MRFIKLGLISVVVFSLLITAFSLMIPSHVRISKAIDISVDRDSLLNQLSNTNNWKNWYPGADSIQQLSEITTITDSTIIAKQSRAESGWNLYDAGIPGTLTVQWYMDFHLRWYPWEKFSSLLLEKRYGPIMEKGLDNLEKLLEK